MTEVVFVKNVERQSSDRLVNIPQLDKPDPDKSHGKLVQPVYSHDVE